MFRLTYTTAVRSLSICAVQWIDFNIDKDSISYSIGQIPMQSWHVKTQHPRLKNKHFISFDDIEPSRYALSFVPSDNIWNSSMKVLLRWTPKSLGNTWMITIIMTLAIRSSVFIVGISLAFLFFVRFLFLFYFFQLFFWHFFGIFLAFVWHFQVFFMPKIYFWHFRMPKKCQTNAKKKARKMPTTGRGVGIFIKNDNDAHPI